MRGIVGLGFRASSVIEGYVGFRVSGLGHLS